MKSNELRIGNLIWWCHEESESVKIVNLDILEQFIYNESDPDDSEDRFARFGFQYAPIPLNDEWLLRFGFERSGVYYVKDEVYIYDTCRLCIDSEEYGYFEYKFNYTSKLLVYVHQLQNLYFALTGEELTKTP